MPVQPTTDTSARHAAAIEEEARRQEQLAQEQARMEAADQARADEAVRAEADARSAERSASVSPSSEEEPTNKPHRDDIKLREGSYTSERGAGSVVDDVV